MRLPHVLAAIATVLLTTTPFCAAAESRGAPAGRELAPLTWAINGYEANAPEPPTAAQPVLHMVNDSVRGKPWQFAAVASASGEIATGQIVHLHLRGRAISSEDESQKALVRVRLQLLVGEKSTRGLYDQTIPFNKGWMDFDMPIAVPEGVAATGVQVALQIGRVQQVVEFRDLQLRVFPAGTKLEDLPRYHYAWPGREADAAWRAAAHERINAIRRGRLEVRVVDANDKPVPDATVRARMTKHAFAFGTMAPFFYMQGTTPTRAGWNDHQDGRWIARYHHELNANFNCVVNGLILKWPQIDRFGMDNCERYFGAARAYGMQTRGHCLIWPKWQFIHRDIRKLENDPKALRAAVEHRVRSVTKRFAPLIDEWDVLNEPVTRTDLQRILGEEILVDIFRWAREEDPTARLYINNFGVLTGTYNEAMADGYERIIRMIHEKNVGLGGIGLQGHLAGDVTPPAKLLDTLDRFGKFGLPIRITEYSHHSPNEDEVADYMRDFLTAVFSHKAVDGFIFWGFTGRPGKPGMVFTEDWQLTGSGKVYRELVLKQWWTDEQAKTSDAGVAAITGFYGDYEVTVTTRTGATQSVPARLARGGSLVLVQLP
jgi:GH35 family endo-1,4-beta-xylanase